MSGSWSGWLRRIKGRTGPLAEGTPAAQGAAYDPRSPITPVSTEWPESLQPALSGAPADKPQAPELDPVANSDLLTEPVSDPVITNDADRETLQGEEPTRPDARHLLTRGQLGRAQAAAIEPGGDRDGRMAALMTAIDAGEAILQELGLGQTDKETPSGVLRGVMLAPAGSARHLLIVFGTDDGGFVVPASLTGAKRQHLLFVQDRLHCLALLGVDRLGGSYDACLANILRIQRRLGARDLYCLGAGGGMYSALRYGLDLGGAGVAALGTLTRLQSGQDLPGKRPSRSTRRLLQVADRLGNDLEQAYRVAAQRPRLALCRAVLRDQQEEEPAPQLFSGLSDVAVMDAPKGAGRRLLTWADASGRLRMLVGEAMGIAAPRPLEAGTDDPAAK